MSGFVKLSDSIFGSSIMDESEPTRLCWMYLLAMADRNGIVDETPAALARRFNMDPQHVLDAIAALEAEDPQSRSAAEDGRRLVRLDQHRTWGWRIVNYTMYRNARDEVDRREYKRRWMANERALEKDEKPPYPEIGEKFSQSVDTLWTPVDSVDSGGPKQRQIAEAEADKKQTKSSSEPVADDGSEVAYWIPVVKGAKPWPSDVRTNGTSREAPIREAQIEEWSRDFGGVDVRPEIQAAIRWCKREASKRKTPIGVPVFLGKWLERASKEGKLKVPRLQGYDGSPLPPWTPPVDPEKAEENPFIELPQRQEG